MAVLIDPVPNARLQTGLAKPSDRLMLPAEFPMIRVTMILPGLFAAALLCQCGPPRAPQCGRVPATSRVPAPTLLAAARQSWAVLANPASRAAWPAAQSSYNAAITKLFDQLRCGPGDWQTRAAAQGTRIAPPDETTFDVAVFDALFPASLVGTGILDQRMTTAGLGLPLVGWKKTAPLGRARPPFTLPTGQPYLVTATLDFNRPGPPVWQLTKRWIAEETPVAETRHPLAADWSAPNAFFWKMSELDNLKLQNVLLPARFTEETGIYFLEPYDPGRIPLVLVHGLVASPDAFKETVNALIPHSWFRQHYQIWLYNYPTGNPWQFSASRFRANMREACAYARAKGAPRNLAQMVVVGHSMGGLITHASVTDPGNTLYAASFSKPPDQLRTTEAGRRLIQETLLYQPLRDPKRVIFLATPHRGSPMADQQLAVWFSRLIRLPKTLTIGLLDNAVLAVTELVKDNPARTPFSTSIGTLSPANETTRALATLPLPPKIQFHSIIGDLGRGNSPLSNDGVVPYWSSHITPVASEKIVPTWHSVQDHPETNAEIARILLLHLGKDAGPMRQ